MHKSIDFPKKNGCLANSAKFHANFVNSIREDHRQVLEQNRKIADGARHPEKPIVQQRMGIPRKRSMYLEGPFSEIAGIAACTIRQGLDSEKDNGSSPSKNDRNPYSSAEEDIQRNIHLPKSLPRANKGRTARNWLRTMILFTVEPCLLLLPINSIMHP